VGDDEPSEEGANALREVAFDYSNSNSNAIAVRRYAMKILHAQSLISIQRHQSATRFLKNSLITGQTQVPYLFENRVGSCPDSIRFD
jgi:hypothetical protein